MIIHVKFIAVTGRADNPTIERYCYDHTKIMEWYETGDGTFKTVLRTEATTEFDVQRKAKYQADRLSSGLYGAQVFDSFSDAMNHLTFV